MDMKTPDKTVVAQEGKSLIDSADSEQKTWLVTIYPAGIGHSLIEVPPSRFVIGRGSECDLMLADSDVSREHCAIEPRGEGHVLIDLSSTNGTFLNDNRIGEKPIQCGDYIRVGTHIMKFLSSDHVEVQYHETVYSMMINDGLTGIHNRRFFLDSLKRELARSTRHGRPLSLLIFDIDYFKKVNDTYGHLAGDAVLRELCNRIIPSIREDEVFARYGGEEFVVILPEATKSHARLVGERIRHIVADKPVELPGLSIPVTVSVGVAENDDNQNMTVEQLISQADAKLFEAKRAGRNQVAC